MKKLLQGIIISIISLFFIFGILEAVVRSSGYKSFPHAVFQMKGTRMEPRPLFNPDTAVGLKLDSGTYKIYYEDGTYWQTTNNKEGWRITSVDTSLRFDTCQRHIDIFGCSFSYGTGLADSQTYPFLLQKKLIGYRVNNYAVPGQGMAQNFVKMTRQVPIDSGAIIVYAYIRGHDFKTNHANRKKMYPSRNQLKGYYYLYLTESLEVVKTQYDYKPWPLIQYSALMNFLEDRYLAFLDNDKSRHKASKKAVLYLNEFCKKKQAKFIFTILDGADVSLDMLSFCKQNNIDCVDLSVDISNLKYNLMPYDDHPNFEANKLYAEKLYGYLVAQHLLN